MCLVSSLNKYLCSYGLQIEWNGLNSWDVGGPRRLQTPQRRDRTDGLTAWQRRRKLGPGPVQSELGRGSGWQEDTGGHLVTPTWVTALLTDCDSGLNRQQINGRQNSASLNPLLGSRVKAGPLTPHSRWKALQRKLLFSTLHSSPHMWLHLAPRYCRCWVISGNEPFSAFL